MQSHISSHKEVCRLPFDSKALEQAPGPGGAQNCTVICKNSKAEAQALHTFLLACHSHHLCRLRHAKKQPSARIDKVILDTLNALSTLNFNCRLTIRLGCCRSYWAAIIDCKSELLWAQISVVARDSMPWGRWSRRILSMLRLRLWHLTRCLRLPPRTASCAALLTALAWLSFIIGTQAKCFTRNEPENMIN